jgi:hypothetical protein
MRCRTFASLLLVTTAIIVLLCTSALAGDDAKHGFGFEIGLGPALFLDRADVGADLSMTLHAVAFYGFDDRNLLLLDRRIYFRRCGPSGICGDQALGLGWQRFWGLKGRWSTSIGFGMVPEACSSCGTGYIPFVGVGYEFARHFLMSSRLDATLYSGGRADSFTTLSLFVSYFGY